MAIGLYKQMDVNSSGGGDGSSWALSGASAAYTWAEYVTFKTTVAVAGDIVFMKDGAITGGAMNSASRDGTLTSPCATIGVKAGTTNVGANVVYSDWSIDPADRPAIDLGAASFQVGNYDYLRNIETTGSSLDSMKGGTGSIIENCKATNTGANVNWRAFSCSSVGHVINCEAISDGVGILTSTGSIIYYNYIHDCVTGVRVGNTYNSSCFNIFDTCTIGLHAQSFSGTLSANNTYYECDTGVSGTTAGAGVYLNNIQEGNNTAGFAWSTQTDSNIFLWNHGDDARCTDMWSGVDVTTIYKDQMVTTGDPLFTVAASDKSLQSGSPCLDSGLAIGLGVGDDSTMNKGAWQNPVGGGGGGARRSRGQYFGRG